MNILFFLTPKSEVAYVYDDDTLRQVMEKMEYYNYTAVPMIDKKGRYIGTVTEGDLLWQIKEEYTLSLRDAEKISAGSVLRRRDNAPMYARADMEEMIAKSMSQNFVPIIDDNDIFIGIVTRKDIIQYLYDYVDCPEKFLENRDKLVVSL